MKTGMSGTMSMKESNVVVPNGQPPLFSKTVKSDVKDADSPKSVISDPRIVSPASSASASLERRLTDLKKQPRLDRVHSLSDGDDETPSARAIAESREIYAKVNNAHLFLDPVAEIHSLPPMLYRKGYTSGPSSETSSPRNRISRTGGKDGTKGHARGYDSETVTRRMSLTGSDATTSSYLSTLPQPADHEGVDTKSLVYSLPKFSYHGVSGGGSDRVWRNAAGSREPRSMSLQPVAREPVQAPSRLDREVSCQIVNRQSEVSDVPIGCMYNMLINGIYGPTMEESGSGNTVLRSDESLSSASSTVKKDSGVAYEDQIELNKFVVRGTGAEEIRAGEHKIAWSERTTREHRNSFSGDGRSNASGYRVPKPRSIFSPGDSPGHPCAPGETPHSSVIEFQSDSFLSRSSSHGGKGSAEFHLLQKDSPSYATKSMSYGEYTDSSFASRSMDVVKKAVEREEGSMTVTSIFQADGSNSGHPLPCVQQQSRSSGTTGASFEFPAADIPENHGIERNFHYGGRMPGVAEPSKVLSLMPPQRFVPGQFLTANPLKPRHPPAKWDDAEKWLVNPAAVKSGAHYGNGHISGGSTPQHISQMHSGARHHNLPSANHATRSFGVPGETILTTEESYKDGDGRGSAYALPSVTDLQRSRSHESSNVIYEERRLSVDVNVKSEAANRIEALNRFEVRGHPLPDVMDLGKANGNLLITVNKVSRQTSERQADDLRGNIIDLEKSTKFPSVSPEVHDIDAEAYDPKFPSVAPEGHNIDGDAYDSKQDGDPFAAAIFDQFTKDKFADSITVQSTNTGIYGREFVVMKDAATAITPSTSQRDMATQVSPVPSFHAALTPPRIHNGGPGGPVRLNTTPVHSERRPASVGVDAAELQNCHQAKLALDQVATIDNWTTREEEAEESARSLRLSVSRSVDFKEVQRTVLEARALAWEEAEHSKYIARFHREEAKIMAWEAHQKAKAEADLRKTEVKLEKMRSHANELLQNKIAGVHLKAENMRATAAAECGEQAVKTNQWAQEIRTSGRSPSPPILCCFPRFRSYSPWR